MFWDRVRRACMVLCGRDVVLTESRRPEAALARSRMDFEDAQREMVRLRAEYARLERQAKTDADAAARGAVLQLARRAATVLAQLATMRALAAGGRELQAREVLLLTETLEGVFADAGMLPIGEVGADAAFDARIHQRMSGGEVTDGDPVRVRFVGYACGDTVVSKANVSRKE